MPLRTAPGASPFSAAPAVEQCGLKELEDEKERLRAEHERCTAALLQREQEVTRWREKLSGWESRLVARETSLKSREAGTYRARLQ